MLHLCWLATMCVSYSAAGAVESSPEQTRVQFGRTIRQLKHHWKLGVLLAPLLQLPAATPLGVEPAAAAADEPAAAAAAGGSVGSRNAEGQVQQQVDAVQGLLAAAAGFGLEDCWQWKPLLDGKQVCQSVNLLINPLHSFQQESNCWQWKPLLDGKQVCQSVNLLINPLHGFQQESNCWQWKPLLDGNQVCYTAGDDHYTAALCCMVLWDCAACIGSVSKECSGT
jgi:hypothetical protein